MQHFSKFRVNLGYIANYVCFKVMGWCCRIWKISGVARGQVGACTLRRRPWGCTSTLFAVI